MPLDDAVEDRYAAVTLQPGMLFTHGHQPHSGVDVLQVVIDWPTRLDPAAMDTAWQRAARRHPVLRTAFTWPTSDDPAQVVQAAVTVPVVQHDWTAVGDGPVPPDPAARLAAFLTADRVAGVDLRSAPLLRVTLITHAPDRHTVVVTFHHAVLDGRSAHMLLTEVCTEHDAIVAGTPYQPPQRHPFRDFARWVADRPLDADERFWTDRLAGLDLPTPLPV
ncbi:condensation domain-containing protein, partial [Micromonospora echinofusca]